MKTTVGRLKELISEAVNGVHEFDGYQVGKWYKLQHEIGSLDDVVQLTGIKPLEGAEDIMMAEYKSGADTNVRQRFDVWADHVVAEATPKEISAAKAAAKAELRHMARTIDTSREGT